MLYLKEKKMREKWPFDFRFYQFVSMKFLMPEVSSLVNEWYANFIGLVRRRGRFAMDGRKLL